MPETPLLQEDFSSMLEDEPQRESVNRRLAEDEFMLDDKGNKSGSIIRAKWQDWKTPSTDDLYKEWHVFSQLSIVRVAALVLLTFLLAWFARGQYDVVSGMSSLSDPSLNERYAFVTFLNPYFGDPDEEDVYYTNVRMLIYQTLHAKETRITRPNIDFVVAAVPGLRHDNWDRLEKDGAIMREVAIDDVLAPTLDRWKYQVSKLEILTFTDYDKILFLDADTLMMAAMEDVFVDAGAVVVKSLNMTKNDNMLNEPEPPADYLWASVDDLMGHDYNKRKRDAWSRYRYFNGGFWMARPAMDLYNYTKAFTGLAEGRYNTGFNEQNLLNYVMRRDGPMPWTELDWKWNIWGPHEKEWDMHMVSYHGHLWDYGGRRALAWAKIRREMEEFHAAREHTQVPKLTENGLLKFDTDEDD